jgi:cyanophycinase
MTSVARFRRRLRLFLGSLALAGGLLARPADGAPADYDYWAVGDPAAATPGRTETGLMLMGGSDDVDAAFRWFIQRAGGGRIVILRASGSDDYNDYLFKQLGGVVSVESVRFHNRAAAHDPRVLAIIRRADGIFLAGGDQANYVNFWRGTPVNDALDAHVRAGRPIGGTSAGLAILGACSYGSLDGGSLLPEVALHDPLGPAVTLVKDFLHLPYLEHVITDSHFSARHRLGRLVTFVARLAAEQDDPALFGIGIDEKTALCIDARGEGRVFTGAQGRAWLVFPRQPAETLVAGRPLRIADVRVVTLDPDSRFDLKTRAIQRPAAAYRASAQDGELTLQPEP